VRESRTHPEVVIVGNGNPEGRPERAAREWLLLYNRYVFLVVALREFTRKGWPAGGLRDAVSGAAAAVVEAADRLRARGHSPADRFAGEEAALWERTVRLADAPAGSDGWGRFVGFVWGLSDGCFARMAALRPEGLAVLVGEGAPQPAAVDPVGQLPGEVADQPVIRGPV
jgi:hypothetical protein